MSTNTTKTRVRQQGAVVRALADELCRCAESDPRIAALREQIREEQSRLTQWLGESSTAA
jgi:hypothetical protein